MDNMDNLSNAANRSSRSSSLSVAAASSHTDRSGHDHLQNFLNIGLHVDTSPSEIRMRIFNRLPGAWSVLNRRATSAPNESISELAEMVNDLFVGHMKLTPNGGEVFALPILGFDGVCHGWRVKQPSWQLSDRNGGSLNIRHAITV